MSSTVSRPGVQQPGGSDAAAAGGDRSVGASITAVLQQALKALASLKLTVVLFALSIFLIFAGTLAQVDQGIWQVMRDYFRTPLAWVELQIFFPRTVEVPGAFPYPGGWLLGGLMMTNLLAAHAVRFKLRWKRTGIFLIHVGLLVMLSSEFVTGVYAEEGNMTITEGGASSYTEDIRETEFAIIDDSGEETRRVVAVPEATLQNQRVIRHEHLPFDVRIEQYQDNSELVQAGQAPQDVPDATMQLQNREWVAVEKPVVSGTDQEQSVNVASMYITPLQKGTDEPLTKEGSDEPVGTLLLTQWPAMIQQQGDPQTVTVGGKTYQVVLRFQRHYKDYTVRLKEFRHEQYAGTDTPKDFSSFVELSDPTANVKREARIYMNHPLRYAGETFYQASYKPGQDTTVLQVVRNPGWLMPYIACALISGGLILHFGLSLTGFLRKRAKTS